MKLPTQEDVVLWISAILVVLVFAWMVLLVTGCSQTSHGRQVVINYEYTKHCVIKIKGMEQIVAQGALDVEAEVGGEDCEVLRIIDEEAGQPE